MTTNLKNQSNLFTSRGVIGNKKSKKISTFRPMILSRHPSHNCLRAKYKNIDLLPLNLLLDLDQQQKSKIQSQMVVKGLK